MPDEDPTGRQNDRPEQSCTDCESNIVAGGDKRIPDDAEAREVIQRHAIELSAFQAELLAAAAGDETTSGQDILSEVNDRPRDQPVTHSRLYPNLDTLVEKGLVEKGEIDQRTNSYRATAAGAAVIAERTDWLEAQLDGGER